MKPTIIITNDDSFIAPGIKILFDALKNIADTYMIAPMEEKSTTGHSLTLHNILRVKEVSDRQLTCSGFPADCVYWGLNHFFKNKKVDLVISGINRGANLAQDVYYSGTVAGAREATVNDVPSIAVSLVIDFEKKKEKHHYETAAEFIKSLVLNEAYKDFPKNSLLNVNVPNVEWKSLQGAKFSSIGRRYYKKDISVREDIRNNKYYWIGGKYSHFEDIEGSDCNDVENNFVSMTFLNFQTGMNGDTNLHDELTKRISKVF